MNWKVKLEITTGWVFKRFEIKNMSWEIVWFGITYFVGMPFMHGGWFWIGWVEKQVGSSPLGERPSVNAQTGY